MGLGCRRNEKMNKEMRSLQEGHQALDAGASGGRKVKYSSKIFGTHSTSRFTACSKTSFTKEPHIFIEISRLDICYVSSVLLS